MQNTRFKKNEYFIEKIRWGVANFEVSNFEMQVEIISLGGGLNINVEV